MYFIYSSETISENGFESQTGSLKPVSYSGNRKRAKHGLNPKLVFGSSAVESAISKSVFLHYDSYASL